MSTPWNGAPENSFAQGRLRPYLQILDWAGKTWREQTLQLIIMFVGKAWSTTWNGAPEKCFTQSRLRSYSQTLDLAGKACN
jgi:hypothetical protein